MNKLGIAIGGLLMIGALTAPVAFAHYDTGAHPTPYATTGQDVYGADDGNCGQVATPSQLPGFAGPNCGPGGVTGDVAPGTVFAANKDRVSGWYYGSTNTYTELDSRTDIINPLDPALCPGDEPLTPPDENAICVALTSDVNPSFFASQASGLYDAEVGGLGVCDPTDPLSATAASNEGTVDGNPGLGSVPDGLWNDGGHGAVGHTFGHYDCADWETAGCDRYDQAFAEDAVGGEDVWIGAICSWGVPVSSGPSPTLVQVVTQFVGDVINCPLGGFPQSCFDAVNYLDDCSGLNLLPTLLPGATPPNCGGGPSTIVCGAGTVSDIDFGRGQGSDGPASAGTGPTWPDTNSNAATYPDAGTSTLGVNCDSVATAAVFPYTAVVVTQALGIVDPTDPLNASPGAFGIGHLSVATYGWVA